MKRARARNHLPGWGVFLFFACLYALSIGRGFYSSDGEVMFQTTAALAERGTFALAPDPALPQIAPGQQGRSYNKYDPGLPLLGVPFYVAGDWIARINAAHRYRLAATWVLLIPALAAAGAVAALAQILRCASPPVPIEWRGGEGPHATDRSEQVTRRVILAAGLSTPLWPYGRMLFAEATLACALTVAVAALARFTPPLHPLPAGREGTSARVRLHSWLVLGGLAFGVGILTRAALAIYAPALALLIARQGPTGRARDVAARWAAFAAGTVPFVAILLWHNALRFGDPLQFGYTGEGFTTPPWEGAVGLLFSPGKSVFLYAPPLLLSVALWPRFRRMAPALADVLALAWGTALLFYGAWWAWHGGWSWGPRLLVPLMPLSCLPLAALPDSRPWHWLGSALIVAGIAAQLPGVLTDVTPHYAERAINGETDYAAIHYDPRQSPLVGGTERLIRGDTEPLGMFHLSDTGLPPTWTLGAPALLILGLITGATTVWRKRTVA